MKAMNFKAKGKDHIQLTILFQLTTIQPHSVTLQLGIPSCLVTLSISITASTFEE